jgi:hypothetical protein
MYAFDPNIATAVIGAALLVVFIRISLTLKDISEHLARAAGGPPTQVKVDFALPPAAPEKPAEPDETEIAAVIAVAKAALERAL